MDTTIILLDIDGVMVTTPSWQSVELMPDGFMKFNDRAVKNLKELFRQTNAELILTTTHRVSFSEERWLEILKVRDLHVRSVAKLNDRRELSQLPDRATEISEWFEQGGKNTNFVIIDDDSSINKLSDELKTHWVQTKPLIGFDEASLQQALRILLKEST
jgi:hypothetical protein